MSQVMKTPQSNFSGPIVVDPLTRIEGHLRIEVEVENGRIKDYEVYASPKPFKPAR